MSACAGDADELETRCTEARAALAQARVDLVGPPPNEQLARDFDQHRKNFESALGDSFVQACVQRGDDYASCILDADTPQKTLDCTRVETSARTLRDRRNP